MISKSNYEELHARYGHYGKKLEKALKLLEDKSVKLHKFSPSGREIWTVVGKEGDQLVDDSQPYCSCRHFYYRVLSEKDDICYHLLGLTIAKKINSYDIIEFQDFEYQAFLEYLLRDVVKLSKD
ncbi:MAG: SWIM zinc finger family protein [archaeon]|nr:SWIM zinc finger family protein [archaeon]MCP8314591.1 SWIM zinc finger family protein [archaeon]